ncbi:hypothetical protein BDBG_06415 [Blastomyces gilchristii SLH14081]|uniref:Secreted protein n=1 Tax=Blastomyces gilchristii (strain SLH14081) TaxID=559298 RepID=A0A179URF4_BLAGS|nr:uncharacterized protein BDBG_06415 [Blastomyces gilchristii SLH14081]OAT10594.1 hypothetical protein BDBG_06415 [Blastomyces gilchristii SLH14081]
MQLIKSHLALVASSGLVRAVAATSTTLTAAYSSPMVPPINSPTPLVQSCNRISERYVARGTLKDILELQFCPDMVKLQPLVPDNDVIK